METTTINVDRRKFFQNKKQKILFFTVILFAIILLFTFLYAQQTYATGSKGYETYNHLVDGTFYYEDSNSTYAQKFQAVAASILRIIFPFMTVFGLTVMVVKMSASVVYLSAQDFFDEVHYHHYQRRQRKYAGSSKGSMRAFLQMMKENGLGDSVIKGVLIPDVKAWAFYDACEIGEDGRPSMSTFFKNSVPKYIVIIAMIIMINDQTMLNLYFRGAEIGVHFFQKAASYDYIGQIERFLATGSNYDPGYKGAKKNVYKSIESKLLGINKSQGTEKTEYKQRVGAAIAHWLDNDATFANIDWNNYRVTSTVTVDTIALGAVEPNTAQKSVSEFGVESPEGERFITVRLTMENKNFWKPEGGQVRTTDPQAWSASGNSLVFDLTKTSGAIKDINSVIIANWSAVPQTSVSGAPTVSNDGKVTVEIADPNKFEYIHINARVSNAAGDQQTITGVYKNAVTEN